MQPKTKEQHRCLGYFTSNSNGTDYDCEYMIDFPCDECIFVHRKNGSNKGKYPWAKKYSK